MADDLKGLARKWGRVKARARSGWDREFADKISKCLKQDGWRPTARQRETIESMCRVYDAEIPEYGEQMTLADGRTIAWSGAVGQWVEVRQ